MMRMQASEIKTRRGRVGVLLICSMSLFMVGLDITAVNVALPAIGNQFHASLSWLQWSVSAYTVVMASLLLFSGSMADRLGRKRTLMLGLSIFTAASVLCSIAGSVELLVVFRVLQGIGASMLNPVAMSIITNTFTDPRERAQAVGVWGAVFGASMAAGPIVGGALVSSVGWQWIFLINLPLGIAALALVGRFVPESRAPKPRRFDPVGQALVVVMLSSLTYGIIEGPNAGWTSPQIVVALGASVLAALVLVRYEPRREEPLIDLRFFRSVPFSASIALSVTAFAAFGGFLFLNTLYLQEVRGLSPIQAGITIVPLALMTMLFSPVSGRLVGRDGPRASLLVAGAALALAPLMLVGVGVGVGSATVLPWLLAAYVVFGIGFGFVNAPITNAAVSGLPVAQAGVAAAIATTSRQFGQAIGVAVAGAIVAAGDRSSLAAASRPAWWLLVALGAAVLVLGLLATGARASRSACRVARRPGPEATAA
jgi:EmrB/QacA subfamily drug resistance transporter